MKVKIMLGLLLVLGTGFSVAALDGGPVPVCRPGIPCSVEPKKFDGGPDPLCRPGVPCPVGTPYGVARQFSGEPIPPCKPGVNCPILK